MQFSYCQVWVSYIPLEFRVPSDLMQMNLERELERVLLHKNLNVLVRE